MGYAVYLLLWGGLAQEVLPPPTPLPPVPRELTPPLQLTDVLSSLFAQFPLLTAAEQERIIAAGQFLSAQGAFDHNLRARQINQPGWNSFESYRFDVGVERFTGVGGTYYTSGYRLGRGEFPTYYGDRLTGEGGEFRGSLVVPLLRDNEIDRRRANLAQAGVNRQIAEPIIRTQRLMAGRAATRAYFAWVASGLRMKIARQLVDVAVQRDEGLGIRVRQGALSPIERTDNQRTIADRQARLVAAERRFQQATFDLSMFLRGPGGDLIPAGEPLLPPAFPDLIEFDQDRATEALAFAEQRRPELERLRLQRERLQIELQWAENQTLPGLNMVTSGAQDVGQEKKSLDRYTAEIAVTMDLPIQRRDARGKVQTTRGQLAQLMAQERFLLDSIHVEVRDALSALDRAYALREQARRGYDLARMVEEGERQKFDLGQSTILLVNLRELATFDAALAEIDALAEYFRALADYRAALGLDGSELIGVK